MKYFELLQTDQFTHNVVKRGTWESSHPFNKIKEIQFKTLGKDFRIFLTPKKELLHSKFKAYTVDADGKETSIHIGLMCSINRFSKC